jgi:hypothetical protein
MVDSRESLCNLPGLVRFSDDPTAESHETNDASDESWLCSLPRFNVWASCDLTPVSRLLLCEIWSRKLRRSTVNWAPSFHPPRAAYAMFFGAASSPFGGPTHRRPRE